MNKASRFVLGIAVSAACLWFAFRQFDPASLLRILAATRWTWLLFLVPFYVTAFLLRTARWRVVLKPVQDVPGRTLFPLLMAGYLLNILLPARAGEVARGVATQRTTGVPFGAVLGSIAFERLGDLFALACVVAVGSRAFFEKTVSLAAVLGWIAAAGAGFMAFAILARRIPDQAFAGKPRWISKSVGFVASVAKGLSGITSPRVVAAAAVFSLLIWTVEAATIYFLSRAFALDFSIVQAAGLLAGISFGVMIPAAPGYVGTYELFGKEALVRMGFDAGAALSFVLVLHFFQIFVTAVLGAASIAKIGLGAKTMVRMAAEGNR